jgi:O-antigen/teichoic acid export membrane protein
MFFSGLIPWVILLLFALFYEPVSHFDPFIVAIGLLALVAPTICFVIGFFQSFRRTGKLRNIGLTLNGLSLAVLLFWVFGGFN